MKKQKIISAATGAVSASVSTEFDTEGYSTCIVVADALATTEEVDISMYVGEETFKAYHNGTALVTLTATTPMREIPCGPRYRLAKDATAAACAVNVILNKA